MQLRHSHFICMQYQTSLLLCIRNVPDIMATPILFHILAKVANSSGKEKLKSMDRLLLMY